MEEETTSSDLMSSDTQYQNILAQRSVARAALHLGIETLPDTALVVLQNYLLNYIERIGEVLGSNVENSGRSSDHVNILDAIRAVECCSVGLTGLPMNGSEYARDEVWIGLAKFLYGQGFVDSLDVPITSSLDNTVTDKTNLTSKNGSAMGTKAQKNGDIQRDDDDEDIDESEGWNAPLDDYDSIPFFPVHVEGSKAILHNSSHIIYLDEIGVDESKHDDGDKKGSSKSESGKPSVEKDSSAVENGNSNSGANTSLQNSPWKADSKFSSLKRKRTDKDSPKNSKRSRTDDSKKFDDDDDEKVEFVKKDNKTYSLPPYVPQFLPPFPPKQTYTKSMSRAPIYIHKSITSDSDSVRSSLVELGRQQKNWGSISSIKEKSDENFFVKVTTRPLDLESMSGGKITGCIKPVTRPSNARISKILEGSMEPHS